MEKPDFVTVFGDDDEDGPTSEKRYTKNDLRWAQSKAYWAGFWTACSVIAGFIALICTVVGTIWGMVAD